MHLLVFFSLSKGSLPSSDLVLLLDSLSSESVLSDESLDLGGFLSGHSGVLFALEGSSDDVLLDEGNGALESLLVLILLNAVKFSNTSGSLGTKSSGLDLVSESGEFFITLLDDGEGEHSNIGADDAASDGSSLSFSFSLSAISFCSGFEEESDSVSREDSLLHGETVLVEAAVDSEDIALELLSKSIGFNFLAHTFLEKDSAFVVIIDFERLGCAVSGVGDTELHNTTSTFILCHKLININFNNI